MIQAEGKDMLHVTHLTYPNGEPQMSWKRGTG